MRTAVSSALGTLVLGFSSLSHPTLAAEANAARTPAPNVPFIISYWVGPPKSETTLERYKEIAECGFNVA